MSSWSGFKSRFWKTGTKETHSCPLLVIMCTVIQVQSVLESFFQHLLGDHLICEKKGLSFSVSPSNHHILSEHWQMFSGCCVHARPARRGFQWQTNALLGCQDTFLLISTCRFSLWHSTHTEDKCTRVFKHANRPSGAWRYFRLYFNLLCSFIHQRTQLKTVTSGTWASISFYREATKQCHSYMVHEVLLKVPKVILEEK